MLDAAAELLDAADQRMGAADWEWIAYDHASREAAAWAAAVLPIAEELPDVALLCLQEALVLLRTMPLPTGHYVFEDAIKARLGALGLPFDVRRRLSLVA